MHPDTTCKNCGFPLGIHRPSDEACPINYRALPGMTPTVEGYAETKFSPASFPPLSLGARANLRKVVFARWASNAEKQNGPNFKTAGIEGFFHCFGHAYEEYESGPGNYSTAIVEDMWGQVFEISPSDMKFLS